MINGMLVSGSIAMVIAGGPQDPEVAVAGFGRGHGSMLTVGC